MAIKKSFFVKFLKNNRQQKCICEECPVNCIYINNYYFLESMNVLIITGIKGHLLQRAKKQIKEKAVYT